MANCTSLTALTRECGTEGIMGGILKMYIMAYADFKSIGAAGSPIYTETTGTVSALGIVTAKKFVEIGLLKSTAGIVETLTKNAQNGTAFYTQDFSLVLSNVSAENRAFVKSVLNQPVSIIVKGRNNKDYIIGLNGLLELDSLSGGTGVAEGDLNGYTLGFKGLDSDLVKFIDPALYATILTDAA